MLAKKKTKKKQHHQAYIFGGRINKCKIPMSDTSLKMTVAHRCIVLSNEIATPGYKIKPNYFGDNRTDNLPKLLVRQKIEKYTIQGSNYQTL